VQVTIMFMSGVDDGRSLHFESETDGLIVRDEWTIRMGRESDNDVVLRDRFASRHHGRLLWKQNSWWLEDQKSTNGTFVENDDDFFNDTRVQLLPVVEGQLFRVGRTWLRIEVSAPL
jgi:predicted component of type VI protein secretion system